MMSQEQLRQNVEGFKGEEKALVRVLEKKLQVITLLDEMEGHIAAANLSAALTSFVGIQKIEVGMIVAGLEERLKAVRAFLKGAESPIAVPTGNPAGAGGSLGSHPSIRRNR